MLNRKIINKKLNFWRKHLKLNPKWDITFAFHKSALDMPEDCQDVEACIDIEMAYFDAHIDLNGAMLDDFNVDNVLIHELLHIIIEPLDHYALLTAPEKYHDQIRIFAESAIENLIPGIMAGIKINKGTK
jgi:hypothetical protein